MCEIELDPVVIFRFHDMDDNIHQALGSPAVQNINIPGVGRLLQGTIVFVIIYIIINIVGSKLIWGQACVSLLYAHARACQTELLVRSHSHWPVLSCLSQSYCYTVLLLPAVCGFSFTFLSSTFSCIP